MAAHSEDFLILVCSMFDWSIWISVKRPQDKRRQDCFFTMTN